MNTRKMQFERVIKYSIRKFSVGVGSAVIGTFLLGANNFLVETVSANEVATPNQVHYRYLAEQELTEAEKALIHHELPSDLKQDDVVYLVYRKKEVNSQQLPNTGSKELALATLGFATASMVVVVMSKKHRNKMLGLLFIGALGGSYFIPQSAQAFENKILVSYNQTITASSQEDLAKGIIQIEGYEYVGYFKASDFQDQPEQMTTAKGTQEEGHEGESWVQPEAPAYTGELTAKGTQEEGHEGESLVQPEAPAYTGEISAKGTQEAGHEGESLVQPELPEYTVAEATITETETVAVPYTKEYVADDTRYTDEETVIQNGQAGSQLIHRVYKTVNGQKVGDPISTSTETVTAPVNEKISRGTKAIEGQVEEVSFEEIPFETRTEVDSTLPKGTEVVAQAGQNGKKKITKVYKTLKGVKTADAPTISEEVVEAVQDRIIKKGDQILTEPTLTLTHIDKEELERSAKVRYQLVKPTGVTIKSLEVVLKDGDTSLQTVNMSEGDLTANLTDLKYYKDYKIATKMVYDRGNGNEEVVLTEEPLRLDLKKVEVKNIKETSLISVDDQGVETDNSLLSAKPSDVKPYYLKVTTHDNKVTKLAVDKIEEVTVDGKALFKVTAKAPDLVQRNADNQFTEEYVHYFAKPKAHEGDVYYDFNDLVKAM